MAQVPGRATIVVRWALGTHRFAFAQRGTTLATTHLAWEGKRMLFCSQ